MFNLNENNRIVMEQHPIDMRIGESEMCRLVSCIGLEPANVWGDAIEHPILKTKVDKNASNSRIYQAKVPEAIIGSNYVGADMLAQIVIDKIPLSSSRIPSGETVRRSQRKTDHIDNQ